MPQIGTNCPSCQKGYIIDNSFVSYKKDPKGINYQSVSCKTCQTDWVVSQFDKPKTVEVQTQEEYQKDPDNFHEEHFLALTHITEEELRENLEEIKAGIKVINENIKALAEMAKG